MVRINLQHVGSLQPTHVSAEHRSVKSSETITFLFASAFHSISGKYQFNPADRLVNFSSRLIICRFTVVFYLLLLRFATIIYTEWLLTLHQNSYPDSAVDLI